jgi:hypothetical protein
MRDCQEGPDWTALLAEDGPGRGDLRCPECHGRVFFFRRAKNGASRAHFEHQRPAHTGCPRTGRKFSGLRTLHPEALE